MCLIRARNGDQEAIEHLMEYLIDCSELEAAPDKGVVAYFAESFENYLDGDSLERAFRLKKARGAPTKEDFDEDLRMAVAVAHEKKYGERSGNLHAFEEVAGQFEVSVETVKRAWNRKIYEKPESTPQDKRKREHISKLKDLIDDEHIESYRRGEFEIKQGQ